MKVDGHDWLVKERPGTAGCYDFDWISGPNPGYGFSLQTSNGISITEADMRRSIASFPAEINPETGYLD
ncbi:hypothetical protein GTQ99_04785 [Kineococcus sp. T13]|uniref:hypothetical protein n=1 Tax=Kineococcus vitellinus TaxID=2696565 RepID=UPI0014128FDA|nr:hypothetical protein [Kineococcus vitellinus]NAZ74740.1 hypothetical protein [Kineococcus vitellinus]